jgi:hypothetical protein
MLLTRISAKPADFQINNALPDNGGSSDTHVTTLSLRLSLLGVQPGMRVHCELPRRPVPTDAALNPVRALTLQHLQAVIINSNATLSQRHPPVTPPQNVQTSDKLPPGDVNMIPVLATSRLHNRMEVTTLGSSKSLFQPTLI